MSRVASPERRRKWLILLCSSIIATTCFIVPGGILINLATAPCPQNQKNDYGQCEPYSTIMWVLGPLFTTFACITFIWFITMVTLRFSSWYTRGNKIDVEGAKWIDDEHEVLVVDGKKYMIANVEPQT